MSWRDELRPASFRDVPFLVESATRTQTLHIDEQIFPGRETPGEAVHVEPLGAGPDRFRIDAFVIGEEYHRQRDALEAALLEPGPGVLVHPWRGERRVSIIGQIQTSEQRGRGGFARITFDCVVTEGRGLRRSVDTQAVVDEDLDAFLDQLTGEFEATYDPKTGGAFKASSESAFSSAVEQAAAAQNAISAALGEAGDLVGPIAAEELGVVDLGAEFGKFVGATPIDGARMLIALFGIAATLPTRLEKGLEAVPGSARTMVDELVDAFEPLLTLGTELQPIPATTSNRAKEEVLRVATIQLVRGAALGQLVHGISVLPFSSAEHARGIRDRIVGHFDSLVLFGSAGGATVSGAGLHDAIASARRATIDHLSAIARSLPEVTTYTVPTELPALVVAQLIYGDALREAELVGRNNPRHPGAIAGGTILEVLRG